MTKELSTDEQRIQKIIQLLNNFQSALENEAVFLGRLGDVKCFNLGVHLNELSNSIFQAELHAERVLKDLKRPVQRARIRAKTKRSKRK